MTRLSELEEEIADEISGIQVGSGYYAMTIGIDAAREAVEAISPLLNRVRAEAWHEGHTQALANIAWPKERKTNPYRVQNSEGNET